MNELADPALLCFGAVVLFIALAVIFAGPLLARWLFGDVPGGRK